LLALLQPRGEDQQGAYKLACRFNRDDLVKKIQRIAGAASEYH
jgi:hypothetical protein